MSHNLKIFLGGFLLSLPFWWGTNTLALHLEDLFFWNLVGNNPEYLAAQASLAEQALEARPMLKNGAPALSLDAGAALSLYVNDQGATKVLFAKNVEEPFPIASLTKLMTAYVVARHYDLTEEIRISAAAVAEEESLGFLRVGDRFAMETLLYPLLMESSNDAAAAFAFEIGKSAFVDLMNLEAERLGLEHTKFVNHAGLDPDIPKGPINYSSPKDLATLTIALQQEFPEIFQILSLREEPLYTLSGFHHTMKNTNELLAYEGWPTSIVGGKTGWTPEAKGTLVLVLKSPKNTGYVVNVILHSDARFQEMKEMVDWAYNSHRW